MSDLGQAATVDVVRALLASDVRSATAFRLALPAPLPTAPTPAVKFADSAGRPPDVFDFAVATALSSGGGGRARRGVELAGVVELSGNPGPGGPTDAVAVLHARRFRKTLDAADAAPRFVALGTLDATALKLLATRDSVFAVTVLDSAADAIARLPKRRSLEALDLSRCTSLEQLGTSFLRGYPSLRCLALPSSVTSVGTFFCASTGIETLDLSRCTSLTRLDASFLHRCKSLRNLTLPPVLTRLRSSFCQESGIEAVDLSRCTALTHVGNWCLVDCVGLRSVKLPASVTSVGDYFCTRAGLEALDLSHCTALTMVGDVFLGGCTSLRSQTLPSSVTSVGAFFCGSTGLEVLDVSQCASLTSVGDRFCNEAALTELDLSQCTSLTHIGASFLSACKPLRELALPAAATSVGPDFCARSGLDGVQPSQCTPH